MPKIIKCRVRMLFINVCYSQLWISHYNNTAGNDSKALLAQRTSMTNIQNSANCVNLLLCITYYHKSVHSLATLSTLPSATLCTLRLHWALSGYPEHSPATPCTLWLPRALSGYPEHSPATPCTLRLPWLRFSRMVFLSCKANARV